MVLEGLRWPSMIFVCYWFVTHVLLFYYFLFTRLLLVCYLFVTRLLLVCCSFFTHLLLVCYSFFHSLTVGEDKNIAPFTIPQPLSKKLSKFFLKDFLQGFCCSILHSLTVGGEVSEGQACLARIAALCKIISAAAMHYIKAYHAIPYYTIPYHTMSFHTKFYTAKSLAHLQCIT